MLLCDRYDLDDAAKVRYTTDGYMVAMPRVARTGIQLYYGSELGMTGQDAKKVMKVYRSQDEVFKSSSLQSFPHKPITDDHPPVNVTADNWSQYAKGQAGDEVVRDGDFIRVPMVVMDGGTIKKFKDGKAELSVGYECEIDFSPGTAPDGTQYDAMQKNIRANHIAVVDAARGGGQLRIGDGTGKKVIVAAHADGLRAIMDGKVDKKDYAGFAEGSLPRCLADKEYPFASADGVVSLAGLRACKANAIAKGDGDILAAVDSMLSLLETTTTSTVADGQHQKEVNMSKIMSVDGISVEVMNDQAAQIIQKALDTAAQRVKTAEDAFTKANTENETNKKKMSEDSAKHVTEMATKDAEIATLKKQVEDAKITPAKLDQLVKDRAVIAGKARSILGDKLVVDSKTDTEIMRQVVDAKLGDAAKGWGDAEVKVSFDTLTAGVKPTDAQTSGLAATVAAFSTPTHDSGDARAKADAAIAARDQRLQNAYKGAGRAN
jgi:hypothetical protein